MAMIINMLGNGGGGGNRLVYETGKFSPTTDTWMYEIIYKETHDKPPVFFALNDITEEDYVNSSNISLLYTDMYQLFNKGIPKGAQTAYAYLQYTYKATSNPTGSTTQTLTPYTDPTATNSNYTSYWATEAQFNASSAHTGRAFIAGRVYEWIAVWLD